MSLSKKARVFFFWRHKIKNQPPITSKKVMTLSDMDVCNMWRIASPLVRLIISSTISYRLSLSEIVSLRRQQLLTGSLQGFPVVMWVTVIDKGTQVQIALPHSLINRMLHVSDSRSEYIFSPADARPTVAQLEALLHQTQLHAGVCDPVPGSRLHHTRDQQYRIFTRIAERSCLPLLAATWASVDI